MYFPTGQVLTVYSSLSINHLLWLWQDDNMDNHQSLQSPAWNKITVDKYVHNISLYRVNDIKHHQGLLCWQRLQGFMTRTNVSPMRPRHVYSWLCMKMSLQSTSKGSTVTRFERFLSMSKTLFNDGWKYAMIKLYYLKWLTISCAISSHDD